MAATHNFDSIYDGLVAQQGQLAETYRELIGAAALHDAILDKNNEIAALKGQLDALRSQMGAAAGANAALRRENAALRAILSAKDNTISGLRARVARMEEYCARVRSHGATIVASHTRQFRKILAGAERLSGMLETAVGGRAALGRDGPDGAHAAHAAASSIELLVAINNAFAKITVLTMKLLQKNDASVMNKWAMAVPAAEPRAGAGTADTLPSAPVAPVNGNASGQCDDSADSAHCIGSGGAEGAGEGDGVASGTGTPCPCRAECDATIGNDNSIATDQALAIANV